MMHTLLSRTLLVSVLSFCATTFTSAQDDDRQPPSAERLQEIRAQRSAYLTTRLKLTQDEAQRFWPVYNEYDEKRETLRGEMRRIVRDGTQEDKPMGEQEALKALDHGLDIRQRELDLERDYKDRFVKLIGAERTLALHRAEREFQRDMIRKFRRSGEGRDGPPRMMHGRP